MTLAAGAPLPDRHGPACAAMGLALAAALLLHLGGLVVMFWQPADSGSRAAGETGLVIGLGRAGGSPGHAAPAPAEPAPARAPEAHPGLPAPAKAPLAPTDAAHPPAPVPAPGPAALPALAPAASGLPATRAPAPDVAPAASGTPARQAPAPNAAPRPEAPRSVTPPSEAAPQTAVPAPRPGTESLSPVTPDPAVTVSDSPVPAPPAASPRPQPRPDSAQAQPRTSQEPAAPQPRAGTAQQGSGTASTAGRGDGSQGGGTPAARADFAARVAAWIARHKIYPRAARSRRLEGNGTVWFRMDAHGRITAARLTRSTGHQILDTAITDTLRRAQPLPRIPAALGASALEFSVPMRFTLR